jgi:hypothetical protein
MASACGPRFLHLLPFLLLLLFLLLTSLPNAHGQSQSTTRSFLFAPKQNVKPQLILIGGCTGTGKSTFGMSVALSQSILKCVSTDVIREISRNTVDVKPDALMRSSYQGNGEPVADWRATCEAVEIGVQVCESCTLQPFCCPLAMTFS